MPARDVVPVMLLAGSVTTGAFRGSSAEAVETMVASAFELIGVHHGEPAAGVDGATIAASFARPAEAVDCIAALSRRPVPSCADRR